MMGILFAFFSFAIPNVGWIVAAAWLYIWIALAFDEGGKFALMVGPVFLGLLLWFIPVVGGWIALTVVLSSAVLLYWPKLKDALPTVESAPGPDSPGSDFSEADGGR